MSGNEESVNLPEFGQGLSYADAKASGFVGSDLRSPGVILPVAARTEAQSVGFRAGGPGILGVEIVSGDTPILIPALWTVDPATGLAAQFIWSGAPISTLVHHLWYFGSPDVTGSSNLTGTVDIDLPEFAVFVMQLGNANSIEYQAYWRPAR